MAMFRSFVVALCFLSCATWLVRGKLFSKARALGDWSLDLDLSRALAPKTEVRFKIALHPKDPQGFAEKLRRISTPGSEEYRDYLAQASIKDLVSPDQTSIQKAVAFLSDHNCQILETSVHQDWLVVQGSVENIEKMFHTKLSRFVNKRNGGSKVATLDTYTIPDEIDGVIKLVAGLNSFSSARVVDVKLPLVAPKAPVVPADVTPETIYTLYGTDSSGSSGGKLGSQAVVEFGNLANFNEQDLQEFFKALQPDLFGETCGTASGDNNGDIRASVEANLDVQYIMATGVYVNTSTYKITASERGEDIMDEFLDYAYIVSNQDDPALVHSISYGEYGGSYDNETDHQFDYELQKMGARGISVLLASGDNGVGCDKTGSSQEFDYPDSPHITMVGATYLDGDRQVEVGATLSSGGFSKNFMQAEWQADAVNTYLSNPDVVMPSEDFFAPGRAYPDISAFGQNVLVYAGGEVLPVSGTSCSAPIFAGVVALINHELMSVGQPPLGLLNPWLYSNPGMFTDVTEGSNPYQKCDGFYASQGWDPVTGLGTPKYPQMLEYAMSSYAYKAKK